MLRILTLFLFNFGCQYTIVVAQTISKPMAFSALTINDGLSQGMVVRMFQDRYGFMWFATLDGLNRYDGYKFTVYRHDPQNKTSITKSFVQTFFEDSEGRLWIGTVSGGLDLFDRETETFIHINQQTGNKSGLSEGSVTAIAEDKYGNIWVNVGGKLDKIIIDKKIKLTDKSFAFHHVKVPSKSGMTLLSITKTNNLYYADCTNGMLYKLEDEINGKWSVAFKLNDTLQKKNGVGNPLYRIVQMLEDKEKGKFYVFHDEGVVRFDENSGAPEKLFPNPFFKNFDAPMRATLDKGGTVWLSDISNLSLFDTRTGQLQHATAFKNALSLTLKSTYSTFIDRSGLLWIGTAGYGLLKRNTRSELFHHTGSSANYSIKETSNGKIIIGNGIVVREVFDRSTETLTDISEKSSKEVKYLESFLSEPVVTGDNGDWFADSYKLRYHDKVLNKNTYYHLPVERNYEYTELIQCKIKDPGGNIWLGTSQGLLRFSLANKEWSVFKNKPGDPASVSSNVILSLCPDPGQPTKYLWLGTGGGGLNRMNMQTGNCLSFSTKDGLPNDVIYGVLPDDEGNLWMSTNKGLSSFNPAKRTFRNFDYKDGLQSNEFNRGSYCRTSDGCLFFGGVNGFNYFYPNEILKNTTRPQVVITSLKIRNQPVSVQAEGSPLSKSMYLTEKLTLTYKENFISFEFASLDFTYPEKNLYRYKLEGFDKEWINSGNTYSANYTNLDPGTYTFKVKGSNNDEVWNENETSVKVIILPPWYMTWWFRTLMALAVVSAVYGFYQFRLKQALKLQAIRDRIASDLHDEVGSNLSNIYIFSNVAQQKATGNDKTAPLLQKIMDYTQQSMEAMNDIVWMINTRNDHFENIIVRMRTLAAELTETSDCALQMNFDESLNNVKLNMEERKNFYLIYKEAINNLVKYAGCKNVWVDMSLRQNTVTLIIRDNGKGFDLANTSTGNGMFNMKKRAEFLKGTFRVDSKMGEGTTLQLKFKV
ncbi:MAG: two-component regulator propeller domain-containing protein [Bacteroidota bacterium]